MATKRISDAELDRLIAEAEAEVAGGGPDIDAMAREAEQEVLADEAFKAGESLASAPIEEEGPGLIDQLLGNLAAAGASSFMAGVPAGPGEGETKQELLGASAEEFPIATAAGDVLGEIAPAVALGGLGRAGSAAAGAGQALEDLSPDAGLLEGVGQVAAGAGAGLVGGELGRGLTRGLGKGALAAADVGKDVSRSGVLGRLLAPRTAVRSVEKAGKALGATPRQLSFLDDPRAIRFLPSLAAGESARVSSRAASRSISKADSAGEARSVVDFVMKNMADTKLAPFAAQVAGRASSHPDPIRGMGVAHSQLLDASPSYRKAYEKFLEGKK